MTAYIKHLVQVNEIQNVFVKENILDAKGAIVVEKGNIFGAAIAHQVMKAKLSKPIEKYVAIDEEFSEDVIFELFKNFILSDENFLLIYEQRDLSSKFRECINHFCHFSLLKQRLNVLAIQMPNVFDQAFFTAWLSVTVLALENVRQDTLNEIFLAAMSHDFGLLDVDPDVLFKSGKLSGKEWLAIQEHVERGARLLKNTPMISKDIVRAVHEHHETPHGTGYPKGKMDQQLGEWGKILNVLDSVYAIYRKHFQSGHRTLNDLVPIVQMTTLSRGGAKIDALISLMRKTPSSESCSVPEQYASVLIGWVKAYVGKIMKFVEITAEFNRDMGTGHRDLQLFAIQNMARYIKSTLTSCGIINEAYVRWLDQVEEEKLTFAYREIEDVLHMAREIFYQMNRFNRLVVLYMEGHTGEPNADLVALLQKELSTIGDVDTPEVLASYIS